MFCPRCGSSQTEDLRFCKACGANLHAVRQVVDTRETDEKFDWSKTWVAEMFMSSDETTRRQEEAKKRKVELERKQGITPAIRRIQEMKAGVITISAGLGVAAFLMVFMQGVIRSGNVSDGEAEILSRIWIAAAIPIMVGIALVINGYFLSKKIVELTRHEQQLPPLGPGKESGPQLLRPADTTEFVPTHTSVTEGTTRHLGATPNRD